MKSDENSLSYGRYLQAIRLEKKISLEKVAAETRIRVGTLRLIEQEAHDRLPDKVFVKGFLRAYAKAIGADGEEAVRRYASRLGGCQKPADSRAEPERPAPKSWFKLGIAFFVLGGVIALSAYSVSFFRSPPPANEPAAPVVAPAPPDTAPPAPYARPSEGQSTGASPAKFSLEVTAQQAGWIKVIIDDQYPTEHHLEAGDHLRLEASVGFNLLIGNAGGVRMKLNGNPVTISGKSGQVVNVHIP
ncbi:MAG: DUF4115 domain-containing protein [Desulfobacterales bacterium]|nr:MAG: DUF4115 domain-containing protein [Desulfobacterales bacterium]